MILAGREGKLCFVLGTETIKLLLGIGVGEPIQLNFDFSKRKKTVFSGMVENWSKWS